MIKQHISQKDRDSRLVMYTFEEVGSWNGRIYRRYEVCEDGYGYALWVEDAQERRRIAQFETCTEAKAHLKEHI